jgi:hypothetical protein
MIAKQHEADLRLLSPPLDPEKEREAEQLLPRYPERPAAPLLDSPIQQPSF